MHLKLDNHVSLWNQSAFGDTQPEGNLRAVFSGDVSDGEMVLFFFFLQQHLLFVLVTWMLASDRFLCHVFMNVCDGCWVTTHTTELAFDELLLDETLCKTKWL